MVHLNGRRFVGAAALCFRFGAAATALIGAVLVLAAGTSDARAKAEASPKARWAVSMVRDINAHAIYSDVTDPIALGSNLLFVSKTPEFGSELWKSDGTRLGTAPVKDIFPGAADSGPTGLTLFKDRVYFSADDGTAGRELWRTDGTAAGTSLVKDINRGPDGSYPNNLTAVGDNLFFTASDGAGRALYKTDGTDAGTVRVKRLETGPVYWPRLIFAAVGNELFFTNYERATGYELWKSDGTEAGTTLIQDVNPGSGSSVPSTAAVVGRTLFFSAWRPDLGVQLWKTDGTAHGTVLVKEVCPKGIAPVNFSEGIFDLTSLGNRVIFRVALAQSKRAMQFWSSDGTADGTVMLKEFAELGNNSRDWFCRVGAEVIFQGENVHLGPGYAPGNPKYVPYDLPTIWITDGTPTGTRKIQAGAGYSEGLEFDGAFYFAGSVLDPGGAWTNRELCRTNGAETSASLFEALRTGPVASLPHALTVAGKNLFFTADDGDGLALWRTDGSEKGTIQLAQFGCGTEGSDPQFLATSKSPAGERLFFTATGDLHGLYHPSSPQVWVSDGTAPGTRQLTELPPGMRFSRTNYMLPQTVFTPVANGPVFFSIDRNLTHDIAGLWVSDGTVSGTRRIRGNIAVGDRAAFAGKLVFNGRELGPGGDDLGGNELWQADGTENGVRLLAKLSSVRGGSAPRAFAQAGGKLFFCARWDDPRTGWLWATDGQPDNIVRLKKMDVVVSAPLGNRLVISAVGEDHKSSELWISDATPAGTSRFRTLPPGSHVQLMTAAGSQVYFAAYTPEYGYELWRTDGTDQGTRLVKDIVPGKEGSGLGFLTAYHSRLYFCAGKVGQPSDVWTSDGTSAGTFPLVNTSPGEPKNGASFLASAAGFLFFAKGCDDCEPWISDGSSAGTRLLADIRPGPAGSEPRFFCAMGPDVYFTADDGIHGRELWKAHRLDAGGSRPASGESRDFGLERPALRVSPAR